MLLYMYKYSGLFNKIAINYVFICSPMGRLQKLGPDEDIINIITTCNLLKVLILRSHLVVRLNQSLNL